MGTQEVEQFLTYLAVNGRVASSTQNQALSAILFMYKENTHGRTKSGGGNMFSHPESVPWTQGPRNSGGIILMNNHYSEQ
jgi:hypothetical protein